LEEKIKSLNSAQKISDLLYKTYPDILIKSVVPENQIVNLINKIIAHKKSIKYNSLNNNTGSNTISSNINCNNKNINLINTTEVFPNSNMMEKKNLHLSSDEMYSQSSSSADFEDSKKIIDENNKFYSKSNQNFFSSGKNSNINFVDQTSQPSEEDLKTEIENINKLSKNRYDDYEDKVNYNDEEANRNKELRMNKYIS
jgi:hypothetical protein